MAKYMISHMIHIKIFSILVLQLIIYFIEPILYTINLLTINITTIPFNHINQILENFKEIILYYSNIHHL